MDDLTELVNLSFDELKDELIVAEAVVAEIKREIRCRAKDELAKVNARAAELAKFVSSDAEADQAKDIAPVKKANSGAPKYRHPSDDSVTWTGRGKKPKWMQEWIMEGKDPIDLLIAKPARVEGQLATVQMKGDQAYQLALAAKPVHIDDETGDLSA